MKALDLNHVSFPDRQGPKLLNPQSFSSSDISVFVNCTVPVMALINDSFLRLLACTKLYVPHQTALNQNVCAHVKALLDALSLTI